MWKNQDQQAEIPELPRIWEWPLESWKEEDRSDCGAKVGQTCRNNQMWFINKRFPYYFDKEVLPVTLCN